MPCSWLTEKSGKEPEGFLCPADLRLKPGSLCLPPIWQLDRSTQCTQAVAVLHWMQGLKLIWHFLLPMHLCCRAPVLLASRLMHGDR